MTSLENKLADEVWIRQIYENSSPLVAETKEETYPGSMLSPIICTIFVDYAADASVGSWYIQLVQSGSSQW